MTWLIERLLYQTSVQLMASIPILDNEESVKFNLQNKSLKEKKGCTELKKL